MSFVTAAALAIAALVVAPLAAHLLRRGRAVTYPFPPTRLVPEATPLARRRNRLEDRALFAVRALSVLALAALGAGPLVRCSRLSVARAEGGSIALAVVLDDSLSMRARSGGEPRLERARRGALELLGALRRGDAVAVIAAGAPARLVLGATSDLEAAEAAVRGVKPSDRGTDLAAALDLAESSLAPLPHVDKRVVLLSDLAAAPTRAGRLPRWVPLPELAAPFDDCAVITAEQRGDDVTVQVVCSTPAAAVGRAARWVLPGGKAGAPVPLAERAGSQSLVLRGVAGPEETLEVELAGSDAIPEDDRAPVVRGRSALRVGVVADSAVGGVVTGGPPLLEQAFAALPTPPALVPFGLLPDDEESLAQLALLALDDPRPYGPEARAALEHWITRGGVALAWLGEAATTAELASTLEPLAAGPITVDQAPAGLDPASAAWLGDEGEALLRLGAERRLRLVAPPGARTPLRWSDGAPFLLERELGEGLVFTVGLPTSADVSDLALTPAFLALLDRALEAARLRFGARLVSVGSPWTFPAGAAPVVTGPDGDVVATEPAEGGRHRLIPDRAGRWEIQAGSERQVRVAHVDPAELTRSPLPAEAAGAAEVGVGADRSVDVSRETALLLLLLLAAELVLRALRPTGAPTAERRAQG